MPYPKPAPLSDYKNLLPYSSQLFGVYQPILGLRANSGKARVNRASQAAVKQVISGLAASPGIHALHAASPGAISPLVHVPSARRQWPRKDIRSPASDWRKPKVG